MMTEEQYKNIRSQIWAVLGIMSIGFALTIIRMEYIRCHCAGMRVEANNSGINVNLPSPDQEFHRQVNAVLEKRGEINGDLLRVGESKKQP